MKKLFLLLTLVVSALLFASCAATVKEYYPDRPEWSKESHTFWAISLEQEGVALFGVGKSVVGERTIWKNNQQNVSQARASAEEAAMKEIVCWFSNKLKKDIDTNWLKRDGAKTIRFWHDEYEAYALVAYLLPMK